MDLLKTAVVDISLLAVTCRALGAKPSDGSIVMRKRLRARVRTQLRRGLRAYVGVLARSEHGAAGGAWLAACRVAAEARMPHALEQQPALQRLIATQAGSLDGLPAERQDLWQLAHLVVVVREGLNSMSALEAGKGSEAREARKAAKSLRRALRRALVAYARALQRARPSARPPMARGRSAALAQLAQAQAELADLARAVAPAGDELPVFIGTASTLLRDLAQDWQVAHLRGVRPASGAPSA